MKPFSFFFLFLLLTPIASSTSLDRKIESYAIDIYNKEYKITLTPYPYENFNNPGYYATEYLPIGFSFITTNAEKYVLTDNKLQLLKFIPPADNISIIYILRYKNNINPIDSFYGTYLDENRTYGVTTQSVVTTAISYVDHPSISYEKTTPKQSPIPTETKSNPISASVFEPSTTSPITIMPYISETKDNNSSIILFLIIFIVGFIALKHFSTYRKSFQIDVYGSNIMIDHNPIGQPKELIFNLITTVPLSPKIIGTLTKIVTSINEIPASHRAFVVGINPDGKEYSGIITFTKKNEKIKKYKIKRS